MALVLIVGGLLGWGVRQVRLRSSALATIRAAGGSVSFTDDRLAGPTWQGWLDRLTSIDLGHRVPSVFLRSSPATRDAVFTAAGQLGSIESASATSLARLMAGRRFGRLDSRAVLDLAHLAVTDAGMIHLVSVPLAGLDLTGTAVTDAGLSPLAEIKMVHERIVRKTRVTPAGVAAFRAARPGLRLDVNPAPSDD